MEHDVLLVDVGNTLAFLSHEAVADVVTSHGHAVDARVLVREEGVAKRRYEMQLAAGGAHEDAWGLYLRTMLEASGLASEDARAMVAPLRRAHDAFNLWRRVLPGTLEALARAKGAGLRLAIVSNSEGRLPELFERVGLAPYFETIVDSFFEGVRKPDPELFRRALVRLGVPAARCVYLGDIPGVDVVGANAAGIDAVLVDALDFYPDYAGAPRVRSVADYVDGILAAR